MAYEVRLFDEKCPLNNPVWWYKVQSPNALPAPGDVMDVTLLDRITGNMAVDSFTVVIQSMRKRHSFVGKIGEEDADEYTYGFDLIVRVEERMLAPVIPVPMNETIWPDRYPIGELSEGEHIVMDKLFKQEWPEATEEGC